MGWAMQQGLRRSKNLYVQLAPTKIGRTTWNPKGVPLSLPHAMQAALIKEKNNIQKLVYYMNHALNGAEAQYPRLEMLEFFAF